MYPSKTLKLFLNLKGGGQGYWKPYLEINILTEVLDFFKVLLEGLLESESYMSQLRSATMTFQRDPYLIPWQRSKHKSDHNISFYWRWQSNSHMWKERSNFIHIVLIRKASLWPCEQSFNFPQLFTLTQKLYPVKLKLLSILPGRCLPALTSLSSPKERRSTSILNWIKSFISTSETYQIDPWMFIVLDYKGRIMKKGRLVENKITFLTCVLLFFKNFWSMVVSDHEYNISPVWSHKRASYCNSLLQS